MPSAWLILPTYNEAREPRADGARGAAAARRRPARRRRSWSWTTPRPTARAQIADRLAAELAEVRGAAPRRARTASAAPTWPASRRALDGGADLVLEMDCDFSHDPADLPRLIEAAARRRPRARLALRARRRRDELGAAAAHPEPRRLRVRPADPRRAGARPDRRLQVLPPARCSRRSTSTASTPTATASRSR